ncbi:MAG TPA: NTP transferase domain-containing protein [Opitutaceae bacterium]
MTPTLLVLAAGMGSRYGGLKQLDPVGPSGETILDYAVFDAIRAGFGRVVFVIRRDFEAAFRENVGAKYAGRVAVDYVFQALDALPGGFTPPAGREKPWGTGHAVWCARDAVHEPFAVINADDFYGRDAFGQLAAFLAPRTGKPVVAASAPAQFAMVGYRLANTLSESGAVSRGVCTVDTATGALQKIVEQTGILREDVGAGRKFSGDERVSMNCWAFTLALFTALDRQFGDFLRARGGELKSEFYLPEAVSAQIAAGQASVQVLGTSASWFGVTYREDKLRVQTALADLVARGEYPAGLF